MGDILAEGNWCRVCEFLEVPDFDGTRCRSCGCHADDHTSVAVVEVSQ